MARVFGSVRNAVRNMMSCQCAGDGSDKEKGLARVLVLKVMCSVSDDRRTGAGTGRFV